MMTSFIKTAPFFMSCYLLIRYIQYIGPLLAPYTSKAPPLEPFFVAERCINYKLGATTFRGPISINPCLLLTKAPPFPPAFYPWSQERASKQKSLQQYKMRQR